MDITLDELKIIAAEQGFNVPIIEKDYLITYLLFLLKDIKEPISCVPFDPRIMTAFF